MKLTFLGTCSAAPTQTRNVAGLGLRPGQRSEWWLFDCGEGTQHQLLRVPLSLPRLTRVFVSHLHGDHCFGLPGLLTTRGLQGAETPLALYGPVGLRAYVEGVIATTTTKLTFEISITEVEGDEAVLVEDERHTVHAVGVKHIGQTLAFVVCEKPHLGRFRAEEAVAAGIPPGPLFGRLKAGETVTAPDGREVDGQTLVGPPRPGRTVALVADTCDAAAIAPHAAGADLLVHEATFLARTDADRATRWAHSTAADAGALATRIGAARLVLNHFSPRYDGGEGPRIADLVAEAREAFGGEITAARDLLEIEIPLRD